MTERLPEPLVGTFALLAPVMAIATEPWWVIGSAAVALHCGAPIEVADVDVLLGVADARAVLAQLKIVPAATHAGGVFRSTVFARWIGPPLAVEFMAGLHVRRHGACHAVHPTTRVPIVLGDATMFVPARHELAALLAQFGRPKDIARRSLLETLS